MAAENCNLESAAMAGENSVTWSLLLWRLSTLRC